VERELVLRLASLLWRLRRATTMETGLFEIQAEHLRNFGQAHQMRPDQHRRVYSVFGQDLPNEAGADRLGNDVSAGSRTDSERLTADADLARCFLRLMNLPSYPLDRLSRYEATLWRQAGQIVFATKARQQARAQEGEEY
jgi:hypothetical protein